MHIDVFFNAIICGFQDRNLSKTLSYENETDGSDTNSPIRLTSEYIVQLQFYLTEGLEFQGPSLKMEARQKRNAEACIPSQTEGRHCC